MAAALFLPALLLPPAAVSPAARFFCLPGDLPSAGAGAAAAAEDGPAAAAAALPFRCACCCCLACCLTGLLRFAAGCCCCCGCCLTGLLRFAAGCCCCCGCCLTGCLTGLLRFAAGCCCCCCCCCCCSCCCCRRCSCAGGRGWRARPAAAARCSSGCSFFQVISSPSPSSYRISYLGQVDEARMVSWGERPRLDRVAFARREPAGRLHTVSSARCAAHHLFVALKPTTSPRKGRTTPVLSSTKSWRDSGWRRAARVPSAMDGAAHRAAASGSGGRHPAGQPWLHAHCQQWQSGCTRPNAL